MSIKVVDVQEILEWNKTQVSLQSKTYNSASIVVKRGEVYYIPLGVGVGGEITKERPCVILSNNKNNAFNELVIVAPITHTTKKLPILVPITPQLRIDNNKMLTGSVNLAHMRSISKYRIANHICSIDNIDILKVDEAIALQLGVIHHYKSIQNEVQTKETKIKKIEQLLVSIRKNLSVKSNNRIVNEIIVLKKKIFELEKLLQQEKAIDKKID